MCKLATNSRPNPTYTCINNQRNFVAGNLGTTLSNWKLLTPVPVIHEWISDGVSIPFDCEPESFCLSNRHLTAKYTQFVDTEIDCLLAQGAIEKVDARPFCVSPLGFVPKKGNTLRLVCDLRRLNGACDSPKCVYESIDSVLDLVDSNDQFVSIDLKNGFHHVLVRETDRQYLGIRWRGIYYQWRVLAFGLSASPYFVCKLLKPVT
jgi:hypothetical protein